MNGTAQVGANAGTSSFLALMFWHGDQIYRQKRQYLSIIKSYSVFLFGQSDIARH